MESVYDVIVVGAGINGVGIALDAALRGLRVVLVEQDVHGRLGDDGDRRSW